jgi:membrane-bound serine protease (ClpP class)
LLYLIILLLIAGILLAFLETILPSGGLLGFLATCALLGSVILGFMQSSSIGLVVLIVVFIAVPVLVFVGLKALPKTFFGKQMILDKPLMDNKQSAGTTQVQQENFDALSGKVGKTITELRPSGIAEIDGKRYSVVSEGEMIKPSVEIIVKLVEGNNIIVGHKNT